MAVMLSLPTSPHMYVHMSKSHCSSSIVLCYNSKTCVKSALLDRAARASGVIQGNWHFFAFFLKYFHQNRTVEIFLYSDPRISS